MLFGSNTVFQSCLNEEVNFAVNGILYLATATAVSLAPVPNVIKGLAGNKRLSGARMKETSLTTA